MRVVEAMSGSAVSDSVVVSEYVDTEHTSSSLIDLRSDAGRGNGNRIFVYPPPVVDDKYHHRFKRCNSDKLMEYVRLVVQVGGLITYRLLQVSLLRSFLVDLMTQFAPRSWEYLRGRSVCHRSRKSVSGRSSKSVVDQERVCWRQINRVY